ncbi:MAG: VanZ family protein [Acetobacteraceae bacterium]
MPDGKHGAPIWPIALLMVGVILYGSLYPFELRVPTDGPGPLLTFMASWKQRVSRVDFIANVLLYLPFGFFFLLSFPPARRRAALGLVVACGAALSLAIEFTQYYDAGRVTSASDFYTNTIGTLIGGLGARVLGRSFRMPFAGEVWARPIPTMLLLAWLAHDLYPYVPSLDVHKYWNALKPIFLVPTLTPYDLFCQTALWLAVYALGAAIIGTRTATRLALPFAGAVLFSEVLIVEKMLGVADIAGALGGFVVWLLLRPASERMRDGAIGVVLCLYLIVQQLEPFEFGGARRPFVWLPFYGLMHGSLLLDMLAFLEKFFLYGSVLYLLGKGIGRPLVTTIVVAGLLFVTSWVETYLPDRSAEITDTLIAIIVAIVFALLPAGRPPLSAPRAAVPVPVPPPTPEAGQALREWQREQARALGIEPDR